jgi:hypothetical protein
MSNQEQQEEWKTIDRYPGYIFSNKGRAYSYRSNQFIRSSNGQYIQVGLMDCNNNQKHIYLSRIIYYLLGNELPHREVDHINRDEKLNNNIKNLRLATSKENKANKGKMKMNQQGNKPSSDYIGVAYYKRDNKWSANIYVEKKFNLGTYKFLENAAYVYACVASCFKPPNHWNNTLINNFELPDEEENREFVISQKINKITHWLNS